MPPPDAVAGSIRIVLEALEQVPGALRPGVGPAALAPPILEAMRVLHTHVQPPPDARSLEERLDGALEEEPGGDASVPPAAGAATPAASTRGDAAMVSGEDEFKRMADELDDAALGAAVRSRVRAGPY